MVEHSLEKQPASKTSEDSSVILGVTVDGNTKTDWAISLGEYLKGLPPCVIRRKHLIDTNYQKDSKCPQFRAQAKHLFVLDSIGICGEAVTEPPKVSLQRRSPMPQKQQKRR